VSYNAECALTSSHSIPEECTRAILVGHNAFFDLGFLVAASNRAKLKSPFHQFSTIDTVSLSALYYGETVLAKAMRVAGIEWEDVNAHSAILFNACFSLTAMRNGLCTSMPLNLSAAASRLAPLKGSIFCLF
jgi:DNA polymerase III epsilon subunit-like protein